MRRYPHQFSGGQRRAHRHRPRVGGEAGVPRVRRSVAALDVSIQAQVLNLFTSSRGAPSHLPLHQPRPGRGTSISDRVVVMYLGRVRRKRAVGGALRHPNHPYTIALLARGGQGAARQAHVRARQGRDSVTARPRRAAVTSIPAVLSPWTSAARRRARSRTSRRPPLSVLLNEAPMSRYRCFATTRRRGDRAGARLSALGRVVSRRFRPRAAARVRAPRRGYGMSRGCGADAPTGTAPPSSRRGFRARTSMPTAASPTSTSIAVEHVARSDRTFAQDRAGHRARVARRAAARRCTRASSRAPRCARASTAAGVRIMPSSMRARRALRVRFGGVWHVNCHSMPAGRRRARRRSRPRARGLRARRPRRHDVRAGVHALRGRRPCSAMGYSVAVNDPYKGVEIVRKHGRPGREPAQPADRDQAHALHGRAVARAQRRLFAARARPDASCGGAGGVRPRTDRALNVAGSPLSRDDVERRDVDWSDHLTGPERC